MQSFLAQLTTDLVQRHGQHLTEVCVVVPSRRAAVFLREELRRQTRATLNLPEVVSFEDFLKTLTPATLLDKISLAFELYPIYHEQFPDEPFEKYYTWGALLVTDFEEVDHYLVDAQKLFSNLYELKRIDTTIESWLNEDSQPSEFQRRYLEFWERMGPFYTQLRERLRKRGLSSAAMAVREAAQHADTIAARLPWRETIFAGFNALTPAEDRLIHSLVKSGKATTRWDMDAWYSLPNTQEAGKFFRQTMQDWGMDEPQWVSNHLTQSPKSITVTAIAERVGMAKAAGLKVSELLAQGAKPNDIAIVLPDENLLFPLLHSLPAEVKDINVSMGFPLRSTPLYSLVEGLVLLHENADRRKNNEQSEEVYSFRDVKGILRHPYIHSALWREADDAAHELRRDNQVFVTPKHFEKYEEGHLLRFLFQPWTSIPQATDFLLQLFKKLESALRREDTKTPTMELEYLLQFYLLIRRLRDRLDAYASAMDLDTFRRLLREVIASASIPFSGEPLNGLQVLGVLETRLLDFPHIIMLSVNEGLVPSAAASSSFIPFNLRKAFGLPTQEEKDAVHAYHFYRSLQRTRTAHLLFNAESDSFGGGEASRFIAQLRAELAPAAQGIVQWQEETLSFPATRQEIKTIQVEKTDDVIQSLRKFSVEKGFSPSVLMTYLNCTLQFYFHHILHLREEEEVQEQLEANELGDLAHKTLETLYKPFEGGKVTHADLEAMQPAIRDTLLAIWKEEHKTRSPKYGRNLILIQVITDLVNAVIEKDKVHAPFMLHALEQKIEFAWEGMGEKILLKGILDRVDEVQGIIRILDYKTGKVQMPKLKQFSDIRKGRDFRQPFQLSMYAWMHLRTGAPGPVQPSIMELRDLKGEPVPLETGYTQTAPLDLAALKPLEDELHSLFRELFDNALPFTQAEDRERCEFCAFKVICGR
jgi:RecB family exonuclease